MDPLFLIIQIAILLMSVVIHEVSHGAMAARLGDPTAKRAGRLTLNPIKHLDLWGSLLIPMFLLIVRSPVLFGWAKPVPYNPHNLKNPRWGPAMVAGAGPASNLLIALVFGLSIRFIPWEGSIYAHNLLYVFGIIVLLNILLAVFNLIPIPPLDGSKILFAILPFRYDHIRVALEQYGMFILIFFIFFLFRFILPIVFFLFKLIVGSSLFL